MHDDLSRFPIMRVNNIPRFSFVFLRTKDVHFCLASTPHWFSLHFWVMLHAESEGVYSFAKCI